MPLSTKLLSLLLVLAVPACSSASDPDPASPAPPASPSTEAPAPAAAPASSAVSVVPAAQAQRGQNAFLSSCTGCHSSSEFSATAFQTRWRNRTAADLFDLMSATMPEDAPNSLPAERYTEIVAYILRLNGFETSSTEEPWNLSALADVSLASLGAR